MAPVPVVDAIDRRVAIAGKAEQRADMIHGLEDSKRPRRPVDDGALAA